MIGWTRRNRESSERHALWYRSLTPEERKLEDRYQKVVNRKYFRLIAFFLPLPFLFLYVVGDAVNRHPELGMLVLPIALWSFAGPFLFIPTSKKWKTEQRALR